MGAASARLAAADIDDARHEAEVLLAHVLGTDRVQLYLDRDRQLASPEATAYDDLLRRRLEHEPSAYITGGVCFYGLDLSLSPSVLIPRPETELLVEKAIAFIEAHSVQSPVIADIGTGSGAIAIALAVSLPGARIYATDISPSALKIADLNCAHHGVTDRVSLLESDLAVSLPEPVHVIVANLPYVRDSDLPRLPPEIRLFEPRIALEGGHDGLRVIERLLSQARGSLRHGGALLLEIGYDQAERFSRLAATYYPEATVHVEKDLASLPRVASIVLPP